MEDIEALFDSQNGHFIVDSENGRAMLTVHSPGKKGMPVRLTDVLARLELFRVSGFSKNVLEAIVQDADGMPHDVGIFRTGRDRRTSGDRAFPR
ncbi:MAG TPA: hypothetical protein PKA91_12650 [Leptospiraceae bacterium]|nr:hypothetical protein [Leptospiraceae bacterium]